MSERELTEGMKSEIAKPVVSPLLLLKADFDDGPVRVWTGVGDIEWNGETWNGLGNLLSVDPVQEQLDGSAQGLKIVLSGLDSSFFSPVMLGDYQGRRGEIYFGAIREDGSIIDDPYLLFAGKLDSDETEDDGTTSTLTLNVESRLADLLRKREYRYTHQDQQALYPDANDDGLKFVPALQNLGLKWGRA
jgi:hypothetical protein